MIDVMVIIAVSFAMTNTLFGYMNWFARIGTSLTLIVLAILIWHK